MLHTLYFAYILKSLEKKGQPIFSFISLHFLYSNISNICSLSLIYYLFFNIYFSIFYDISLIFTSFLSITKILILAILEVFEEPVKKQLQKFGVREILDLDIQTETGSKLFEKTDSDPQPCLANQLYIPSLTLSLSLSILFLSLFKLCKSNLAQTLF